MDTPDLAPAPDLSWRKSTFSAQGNCVEVANADGLVYVRDSKDRAGPALAFTLVEWTAFLAGVVRGEFTVTD